MRTLVNEISPHNIRVNSPHNIGLTTLLPDSVDTEMIQNRSMYDLFGVSGPTGRAKILQLWNTLPTRWLDPIDIANAALFLGSDEEHYVTGVILYVDAGFLTKKL